MPNEQFRKVPPDIHKGCMILGLRPEKLTHVSVTEAWKERTLTHTATAEGQELAMELILNLAKDTLIKWLEGDPESGEPHQPSGVPRRPVPVKGAGSILLPLPETED